jgi:hypothetical protein
MIPRGVRSSGEIFGAGARPGGGGSGVPWSGGDGDLERDGGCERDLDPDPVLDPRPGLDPDPDLEPDPDLDPDLHLDLDPRPGLDLDHDLGCVWRDVSVWEADFDLALYMSGDDAGRRVSFVSRGGRYARGVRRRQ